MNFTNDEIKIINDALDMATASVKRLQTAKPKYHAIYTAELNDIAAIKLKLNTPTKNK